ncbi:diguanylate cyclase domain-containing protein [Castellaniella sp.]|uniref:diguanylate cyclase domain-containing protein n=1 Tax=Castellaniella sp. TaxID=1955812 RepID=UPI002AFF5207|nr:diguanylate cyclase [Castellaniella sp.]
MASFQINICGPWHRASRIAQAVHFHVHGSSSVLEAAFPEGVPVSAQQSSSTLSAFKAKLQALIEAPLETLKDLPASATARLGAAIGVACWPVDVRDPETLLKHADTDMYANKPSGRRR